MSTKLNTTPDQQNLLDWPAEKWKLDGMTWDQSTHTISGTGNALLVIDREMWDSIFSNAEDKGKDNEESTAIPKPVPTPVLPTPPPPPPVPPPVPPPPLVITLPASSPNLKSGMKSASVGVLQQAVNKSAAEGLIKSLPNIPLAIDNSYGPKTKATITAVQTAIGAKIDGIYGPNTREKWLDAVAKWNTAQAKTKSLIMPLADEVIAPEPETNTASSQPVIVEFATPGGFNVSTTVTGEGGICDYSVSLGLYPSDKVIGNDAAGNEWAEIKERTVFFVKNYAGKKFSVVIGPYIKQYSKVQIYVVAKVEGTFADLNLCYCEI